MPTSPYLPVTLDSTVSVTLTLSSVPDIVDLTIAADTSVGSAVFTLNGFTANTLYYHYVDNGLNPVTFTTDAAGSFTYTQDLSVSHHVWFRDRPNTYHINATGGDCAAFGTWTLATLTCTLTTNVSQSIFIEANGITLDGNGFSSLFSDSSYAVYSGGFSDVTIKNLNVSGSTYGICAIYGTNLTVTHNTVSGGYYGILTYGDSNLSVTNNTVTNPLYYGIYNGNSINYGLSGNVTIDQNTISGAGSYYYGIFSYEYVGSGVVAITNNTISDFAIGISAYYPNNWTMTNNTISNSLSIGLYLYNYYNGPASVYNNNFINNPTQIVSYGTSTSFNQAAPVGGNYFSDFNTSAQGCDDTTPSDGFCDAPYFFSDGQDYLPWTTQNAWVAPANQAPTINAGGAYNGFEGTAIAMNATAVDPNAADILTFNWSVDSALCSFDNASTLNPNLTCTDNGSFTATLTVGDRVNPKVSSAASVTVVNVAPSGSFSISGPIFEGGSATVSFIGASDPSINDTAAGFHYAFDCNGGSLAAKTYATSGTSSTTNCGYADNGSFTVQVKIMDKDDGGNEYTAPVTVNNGAPVLGVITVVNPLVPVNTVINASASFTDSGSLDTHAAVWNWEDATTSVGSIAESGGNGTASASHSYSLPGVYRVTLTVTDKDGVSSNIAAYEYVVVYDPTAGFATGSGSINSPAGAYPANPSATGKGKFGFNTKYKKTGALESETEFELEIGGNENGELHFHSSNAAWLVVNGAKAQFQGTGTVEKSSHHFGYTVTLIDGQYLGATGADLFRLRIWDMDNGNAVVYDNQMGDPVTANPTMPLKGNLKIKK